LKFVHYCYAGESSYKPLKKPFQPIQREKILAGEKVENNLEIVVLELICQIQKKLICFCITKINDFTSLEYWTINFGINSSHTIAKDNIHHVLNPWNHRKKIPPRHQSRYIGSTLDVVHIKLKEVEAPITFAIVS
jgi:hypothetical protein